MTDLDPKIDMRGIDLIQLSFYNEDNVVVGSWDVPSIFRKGAFVAIEGKLSVYHFINDDKPNHVCITFSLSSQVP